MACRRRASFIIEEIDVAYYEGSLDVIADFSAGENDCLGVESRGRDCGWGG